MALFSDFIERLKGWITWTWTYLWLLWFILVIFLFYILKGPLKLTENVSTGKNIGKLKFSMFVDTIRSKHLTKTNLRFPININVKNHI